MHVCMCVLVCLREKVCDVFLASLDYKKYKQD